jgi:hypothetical protein
MALYQVTVTRGGIMNGIRIEKGMSVEVVSGNDPVSYDNAKAAIEAFQRKYGIDIKKAGCANRGCLDVKKIN